MGYEFGNTSRRRLLTCHRDIQKVFTLVLSRSCIDIGISEGHRPVSKQQEYYAIGRTVSLNKPTITNIDGVTKKGNHNYSPSKAVDIYIYHPDAATRKKIAFDQMHLGYIAGLVESCAIELLEKGEITHKIKWGNNWDRDGIIAYDHSLQDAPHFEIID